MREMSRRGADCSTGTVAADDICLILDEKDESR